MSEKEEAIALKLFSVYLTSDEIIIQSQHHTALTNMCDHKLVRKPFKLLTGELAPCWPREKCKCKALSHWVHWSELEARLKLTSVSGSGPAPSGSASSSFNLFSFFFFFSFFKLSADGVLGTVATSPSLSVASLFLYRTEVKGQTNSTPRMNSDYKS